MLRYQTVEFLGHGYILNVAYIQTCHSPVMESFVLSDLGGTGEQDRALQPHRLAASPSTPECRNGFRELVWIFGDCKQTVRP